MNLKVNNCVKNIVALVIFSLVVVPGLPAKGGNFFNPFASQITYYRNLTREALLKQIMTIIIVCSLFEWWRAKNEA